MQGVVSELKVNYFNWLYTQDTPCIKIGVFCKND